MKGGLEKKGKRRRLFKLALGYIEEERKEEYFSLAKKGSRKREEGEGT